MLLSFIEVDSVEEANNVNMELYSFVKFSETRQKYIFKIREHIRKVVKGR